MQGTQYSVFVLYILQHSYPMPIVETCLIIHNLQISEVLIITNATTSSITLDISFINNYRVANL